MKAERQTSALGRVFRFHRDASDLFVSCALQGAYDILPSTTYRCDDLAKLRRWAGTAAQKT